MQTLELQVERSENTLTLAHLATLPKRNKDHFVSIFAQEQQHFSQQYLYEGQRVAQSWNKSELTLPPIVNPPVSPGNDPQLGFGTPVLRARLDLISMRPNDSIGRNRIAGGQGSSKENERPCGDSGHRGNLPDTAKRDFKRKPERQKNKSSKTDKQRLPSDSDNELVERREDRRQRKKTKRQIMNPEFSGDSDHENKPSTTCKIRKQAKRQSKLRQEFALMHGFSSTNVGRNRLTLKPGRRDIGVFQKGKASEKTDVIRGGKHKRQEIDFCFSEATFLSRPRQKASKIDFGKMAKIATTREEVSSSASVFIPGSTKARSDSSIMKIGSRKFKDSKAPSKSNLVSRMNPQSQDKAQTGYNPADSIVWDIEQVELPGSEVSSGMKQGTIVLELAHLPLTSNEVLESQALDTNTTALEAHAKLSQQKSLSVTQSDSLPSPSLGPSQSASQIALRTIDMASHPTTLSKYFKPLAARLAEPHLGLPHYTVNQLDTKPSALSELGELSVIEDTVPQLPELACCLHPSAGLSTQSYRDGQEGVSDLIPLMQPTNDLEVTAYYEGYPDSELWSTVDYPGDLGVKRLNNTDIVDYVSVNFDGEINPSFITTTDDDVCILDYNAYSELDKMDQIHDTLFIPLFGHQSTELHNSFSPSIGLSGAYSDISEGCLAVVYQRSGRSSSSVNLESEDQQIQPDSDFNLEHEGVSSMDPDLYSDVVHHFWQGHSLLYGLNTPGDSSSLHKLSNVEADVARKLQLDHWQPQRL